jgi:MerR family transcriptional regulator, copper efflux regulator
MKTGTAARKSGVPAKTIRYYEGIGLIPNAKRTGAGYRDCDATDVQIVRFVARARKLGFSVRDVAGLLELWRDTWRASGDVKTVAERHIAEIEGRILDCGRCAGP